MQLYSAYIKEKYNRETLCYSEKAFITYEINKDECYIVDIYVDPEFRRSGVATEIAKEVEEIAKKAGCKYLTGTVNLRAKDPDASVKALYFYGFKLTEANQAYLMFTKMLGA